MNHPFRPQRKSQTWEGTKTDKKLYPRGKKERKGAEWVYNPPLGGDVADRMHKHMGDEGAVM